MLSYKKKKKKITVWKQFEKDKNEVCLFLVLHTHTHKNDNNIYDLKRETKFLYKMEFERHKMEIEHDKT